MGLAISNLVTKVNIMDDNVINAIAEISTLKQAIDGFGEEFSNLTTKPAAETTNHREVAAPGLNEQEQKTQLVTRLLKLVTETKDTVAGQKDIGEGVSGDGFEDAKLLQNFVDFASTMQQNRLDRRSNVENESPCPTNRSTGQHASVRSLSSLGGHPAGEGQSQDDGSVKEKEFDDGAGHDGGDSDHGREAVAT